MNNKKYICCKQGETTSYSKVYKTKDSYGRKIVPFVQVKITQGDAMVLLDNRQLSLASRVINE